MVDGVKPEPSNDNKKANRGNIGDNDEGRLGVGMKDGGGEDNPLEEEDDEDLPSTQVDEEAKMNWCPSSLTIRIPMVTLLFILLHIT